MNRHLTRLLAAALAVASVTAATPAPAAAHPPLRYHLALGDSLPYGFTTAGALAGLPPSAFTGFTDLVSRAAGLRTVNYSCPGETTGTFIAGPCGWRAAGFRLHDDYPGSQLAAAEAFLAGHRRDAHTLITLTLWGNDIRLFLASCPDVACVLDRAPAEIAALAGRLRQALVRLRSAAPHARIVLVGAFTVQLTDLAAADRLIAALNAAMAAVGAAAGARFADPSPIFNPPGDATARRKVLCRLTLICAENDSHPSAAGHRALAALVLARTPSRPRSL
ncbi:GDSL-type esterase/lipase family protein [Dactylosporangium sp. NPDC049525]|uniref:GDSL-type esterase/lipase family protein n=1 Tax=Dactylosporangium sp. NPDC049525 TaxID=3154730 RepID=UPI00341B27CB